MWTIFVLSLLAALAMQVAGGIWECNNLCPFAHDGECDDGGPGSVTMVCMHGSDCGDCGTRDPYTSRPSGGELPLTSNDELSPTFLPTGVPTLTHAPTLVPSHYPSVYPTNTPTKRPRTRNPYTRRPHTRNPYTRRPRPKEVHTQRPVSDLRESK